MILRMMKNMFGIEITIHKSSLTFFEKTIKLNEHYLSPLQG